MFNAILRVAMPALRFISNQIEYLSESAISALACPLIKPRAV
jgi:hypothetical protein